MERRTLVTAGADRIGSRSRLDYVDPGAKRRSVAEVVGARTSPEPIEGSSDSYDIVVDGTLLDMTGLDTACRALRRDGTIVGATIYLKSPELPYFDLYSKGAHFHTGRVHARAVAPTMIDLVARGVADPLAVSQGETLPIEDAHGLLETGIKPIFIR
jgi:alcohol dehydrogenase